MTKSTFGNEFWNLKTVCWSKSNLYENKSHSDTSPAACSRPHFSCMQVVSFTITFYEVREDLRVKRGDLCRKIHCGEIFKGSKYRKPFDDKNSIPFMHFWASVWRFDKKSFSIFTSCTNKGLDLGKNHNRQLEGLRSLVFQIVLAVVLKMVVNCNGSCISFVMTNRIAVILGDRHSPHLSSLVNSNPLSRWSIYLLRNKLLSKYQMMKFRNSLNFIAT